MRDFSLTSSPDLYVAHGHGPIALSAAQRMLMSYNQLQRRLGSDIHIDFDQAVAGVSADPASGSTISPPLPQDPPMVAAPWYDGIQRQVEDSLSSHESVDSVNGGPQVVDQEFDLNSDGGMQGVVAVAASAADTPQNVTKAQKSNKRGGIEPSWMFPPRVLVVEDDVVTQTLSTKFLRLIGCATEVVGDAETALAKINQGEKFDLILMDIHLPHISGIGATSIIRKSDMATPIISMTHNPMPDDVESFFNHGMNDFLPKPFTKQGLFGMLEKHLDHLKTIRQITSEIPRPVGVPPLSDQGIHDALASGVATLTHGNPQDLYNPLGGTGFSDDMYMTLIQVSRRDVLRLERN